MVLQEIIDLYVLRCLSHHPGDRQNIFHGMGTPEEQREKRKASPCLNPVNKASYRTSFRFRLHTYYHSWPGRLVFPPRGMVLHRPVVPAMIWSGKADCSTHPWPSVQNGVKLSPDHNPSSTVDQASKLQVMTQGRCGWESSYDVSCPTADLREPFGLPPRVPEQGQGGESLVPWALLNLHWPVTPKSITVTGAMARELKDDLSISNTQAQGRIY
ncbi:uncharacterized protein MCYG_07797 [Microsporum canis CBS 113480]|uniref:Uncharacterized protein n=1 Tax=Arthroderma otae (strain ATCC MYA-4605 / CBS 113480) TaxID=554155 RepID=C5FXD8_ARTOC|nr:uncharacterized protein MCYG_07797 [Microsporum canis CBS 113480]EEQ34978.1 predicted protein [Microsporum canis CBS 113480]